MNKFNSKTMTYLWLVTTLVFHFGCSKSSSSAASPSLPASWIKASADADFEIPSAEFDQSVQSHLRAQTNLLSNLNAGSQYTRMQSLNSQPADWTPWHLDGMIASFAVDINGVFGALLGSGTASVQATWQQKKRFSQIQNTHHKSQINFSKKIENSQIPYVLEPSIQAALGSGNIKNEKNFRQNLLQQAEQFFSIGKALDLLPSIPGWKVDSYQLQLAFNAQGQITASVGAGVALTIYFNWDKMDSDDTDESTSTRPVLTKNLTNFVQFVGPLIDEVEKESSELQKSNFKLDEMQIGIAITAEGDIGVVSASAQANAKVIFKRSSKKISSSSDNVLSQNSIHFIDLKSSTFLAQQNQIKPTAVYNVGRAKFKKGLEKAIRMSNYFVKKAKESDSDKWQITQIETEFDAGLNGDIHLVTISGQGQIVLDFNRIN